MLLTASVRSLIWLIFKLLSETNQDHLQEQNFQRTKLIQAKLNLF